MSHRPWRSRLRATRWLVVCCVLFALPIASFSSLLTSILGPVHFHEPAGPALVEAGLMSGWQDFRRVNHVTDSVYHVHDHARLGRHHHDPRDPGIVVVGSSEGDDGHDPGAVGASGLCALAASQPLHLGVLAPVERARTWALPETCEFRSAVVRRLDRPPSS